MKLLENKTAIITGATRGIGRGIAVEFAKQGANVAFTYSSSVEAANTLEAALTSLGVKAKGYQSNAAEFGTAQELAKEVLTEFGNIDILVNNAGTNIPEHFTKVKRRNMEFLVKVNTVAAFNIAQLCTLKMLEAKNRKKIGVEKSSKGWPRPALVQ